MKSWREWELSTKFTDRYCPECGQSLIITELIDATDESKYFNGICTSCKRQYTARANADDETFTINYEAADQQDRIDALEERVAQLEAIVKSLTERKPLSLPDTPKPTTEEANFRKKYGFLLG